MRWRRNGVLGAAQKKCPHMRAIVGLLTSAPGAGRPVFSRLPGAQGRALHTTLTFSRLLFSPLVKKFQSLLAILAHSVHLQYFGIHRSDVQLKPWRVVCRPPSGVATPKENANTLIGLHAT